LRDEKAARQHRAVFVWPKIELGVCASIRMQCLTSLPWSASLADLLCEYRHSDNERYPVLLRPPIEGDSPFLAKQERHMTNLNTKLNNEACELTVNELDEVSGGRSLWDIMKAAADSGSGMERLANHAVWGDGQKQ
jgi:hypothetical protein